MSFRRNRFGDLIRRQLELFVQDERELLREADVAEKLYDAAEREDAEEAFGDYQLVLESVADRLEELCDAYASTLGADAAETYAQAFGRAARKRFPKLPLHL